MCHHAQFCSVLLFLSSGASYDITQFQKYLGYFWFFISSMFRIKLTDARCRKRQRQMVLFLLSQWHPGSNCSKSLEWIFLDFSVSLHSYTKPHMYGYTYCIQLWESAHCSAKIRCGGVLFWNLPFLPSNAVTFMPVLFECLCCSLTHQT